MAHDNDLDMPPTESLRRAPEARPATETLFVTPAQRKAANLLMRRSEVTGMAVSHAVVLIAEAQTNSGPRGAGPGFIPRNEYAAVPRYEIATRAEAGGTVSNGFSLGLDLNGVVERGIGELYRMLAAAGEPLAPEGLARIGALVEASGGELVHGGALDSQTIKLTTTPDRAVVLPHGSASGLSGEGDDAHAFVVLTSPDRIRRAFARLEGVELPNTSSAAFLRSTVYDGDRRDCVLHIALDSPEQLDDRPPVYVTVLSSAAASDPETAGLWMRWADPDRFSLVMDTPISAALRRWCVGGARFRMQTRVVLVEGMEVRIIAGRVEDGDRRSPLVIIPTTEFGARWFEAARAEDPQLGAMVLEDDTFFEQQGRHLDVVLNHLLYEERFVGTGSWRQ
jgi:hypothetical protein